MAKRPSIFSYPLVRELSLVLLVKLTLIFMIAHYFFSDPAIVDDDGQQLINHFGLEAGQVPDFNVKHSEERAHDQ